MPAALVAACVLVPVAWWQEQLGPMRPGGDIIIWGYDQYYYSLPALGYAARLLRAGTLPLWNPHQLCGTPFLASQLHGILYPLHWLVLFMPVPLALRWALIGNAVVAALGAAWCARAFGASRFAALVAAAAFTFSGTLSCLAIGWMEPTVVSAAWLPWQLGGVRRTLAVPRHWMASAVVAGVAFAMPLLGGHLPYVPVSASLSGAYALAHVLRLARRDGVVVAAERAARLSLVAGVAFGLSAVQLLPTLDLARRSPPRPSASTAPWTSLLGPAEFLRALLYPVSPPFGVGGEGRIGVVALALSAAAALQRRRTVLFLWIAAIGTGVLSLGANTPLFHLYLFIPGVAAFRFPQRFLAATTLCLAILAGLGADATRQSAKRRPLQAAMVGIGLLGLLNSGLWLIAGWNPAEDAIGAPRLWFDAALFSAWCAALALSKQPRWRRGLVIVAAAGVAVELYAATSVPVAIPATRPEALPVPAAAAAFIRERQGSARTFIANPPNDTLLRPTSEIPEKLGMLAGLAVIGDYEPLFDYRYGLLANKLGTGPVSRPGVAFQGPYLSSFAPETLPLLRVLGVRFILARRGFPVPLPPVFDDGQYQVFEVPDPLPRAYVAAHAAVVDSDRDALGAVSRRTKFLLGRGAVVEGDLGLSDGEAGVVEIAEDAAQSVELRAALTRRALVVLQDEYDPYWRVTIDGRPAPTVRTNYVFRGVVAEPGTHTIRFVYRPTLVYVGAAITAATLLGLLALALIALRSAAAT